MPPEIDAAMALLRARVAETSVSSAARELGYSRPAVSMVLSGKYAAGLEGLARRVMERFGAVACPHLGTQLLATECARHRTRPMPTGSTRSFRHWQACRRCPINPDQGKAADAEQ